ncbi:hypothetical protein diail_7337 [Diaporthe ilicicola]|nr:hypothetical protein diail_7337 [Diaporthe ilicicola]
MDNSSTAQPSGPEKPTAARMSTPGHAANHQQPAPQQFQPVELPKPEPFRTSKPFAVAKFALGSFNLVFAIVALGLTLGLVTDSYAFDSFIAVIICLSLAVASIIWQFAEHITLAVRKEWRSIHPGAHVGVRLVLWFLGILEVASLCISLSYELSSYTLDSDCAGSDSGSSGYDWNCDFYSFPSQAAANRYFRMMEALAAFSVLLFISHFTLFVMACIETDRRRKHDKKTKVVYLVAATGAADGRTYYAPLAQGDMGSVVAPRPAHYHQQGNADPGAHGYYAPSAGAPPGSAA